MILITYRHGLRASEVCDLQWHQVELDQGRMHVRRAKNGTPSVHPIRGDEIRALRKLQRESPTEASYVFVTERGGPMSTIGFHHLVQRLGKAARMPFPLHPHMLRHACGYKLANDGHDTRACSTISATRTSSTPSATPSFRPTGSATSGEISVVWMCGRRCDPPGGDFWILQVAHAPSPKNLSKNGFCPQKGGSLSVEGVFAKKIFRCGRRF
jgi:Phage integrase family